MKRRVLVVVGLVAALTAGCSGKSEPTVTKTVTVPAAVPSSAAGQSPAATVDPTDSGAVGAGVDPSNPGKPIASVTAKTGMQEDPNGTLTVDVLSLKRKDKLLVLTLQVTPKNSLSGSKALFSLLGDSFWVPKLIDSVNLKEYDTVQGSGELQSSVTSTRAASGQPMYLYAIFAAPPAGVSSLNLIFASSVPTLNDIPIS